MVNKGQAEPQNIIADWQILRLPRQGYYDVRNVWQVSGSYIQCCCNGNVCERASPCKNGGGGGRGQMQYCHHSGAATADTLRTP